MGEVLIIVAALIIALVSIGISEVRARRNEKFLMNVLAIERQPERAERIVAQEVSNDKEPRQTQPMVRRKPHVA